MPNPLQQFTLPTNQSLSGLGSFQTIDTSGGNWLGFQVEGTFVGAVVAEGSYNGGTSWQRLPLFGANGVVPDGLVTSMGAYTVQALPPLTRLRVVSYTAGTVQLVGGSTVDDTAPLAVINTPVQGAQHSFSSVNTTNSTLVKSTPGNLTEVDVSNLSGATMYLKLYNKASAPVVGTDAPVMVIPISAGATFVQSFGSTGKRFSTGIAYALTGAAAVTDTTAVAAGILVGATYL